MYGPHSIEFRDAKLTILGGDAKDGELEYSFVDGRRVDWQGKEFRMTFKLGEDGEYVLRGFVAPKPTRFNFFSPRLKGGIGHLIPLGKSTETGQKGPGRKVPGQADTVGAAWTAKVVAPRSSWTGVGSATRVSPTSAIGASADGAAGVTSGESEAMRVTSSGMPAGSLGMMKDRTASPMMRASIASVRKAAPMMIAMGGMPFFCVAGGGGGGGAGGSISASIVGSEGGVGSGVGVGSAAESSSGCEGALSAIRRSPGGNDSIQCDQPVFGAHGVPEAELGAMRT